MTSRIEQALTQLPSDVADYLKPIVLSESFDATLSADNLSS